MATGGMLQRARQFLGSLLGSSRARVEVVSRRFLGQTKNLLGLLNVIKQDEWLFVGLSRIADGVMFSHWAVKDRADKDVPDVEPVVKLFKQPNPLQRWPEFVETIIFHWRGAGNAYILMDNLTQGGQPTELWPLRPDRVKMIPSPAGSAAFIQAWEYTRPDGGKIRLDPKDVVWLQFSDPENLLIGMGIVEAMGKVFETDVAAADYARDFFRNGANPGTVLQTDRVLDEEVRKAILSGWDDAHRARSGRAHATAVLEGGLKVEQTGTTPKEADFLETRKAHRESILGALGVQPLKAGITEGSNRATAFVQERSWQRDTITPLLRRLEPAFTVVCERFGPFHFAFEQLVVEDEELDAQIATQYLACGALTPNEIRENYAGMPKVKGVPAMDQFYLPVALMPVDGAGGPEEPAEPGAKPGEKPGAPPVEPIELPRGDRAGGTALQRRVLAAYVRQRTVQERRWRKAVGDFFREQGKRVAAAYAGGRPALQEDGRLPGDAEWFRLTRSLHDDTMQEQYRLTVKAFRLEEDEDFRPGGREYEQSARRLAQKVVGVPDETKARLDSVIKQGLDLGLSPTQIAYGTTDGSFLGIEGLFDEFAASRAQLIARTEAASAMDQANLKAYEDMGVQVCDVIGCEDDVIVEGQEYGCNSQNVPIDQAYEVEFHPNHKGAIVPRVGRLAGAAALTDLSRVCYHGTMHGTRPAGRRQDGEAR